MITDIDTTSAFLGIFGICTGVFAMVVILEVARRFNAALEQQKKDLEHHVNLRINQQEVDLKEALSGFRNMLAGYETTAANSATQMKDLGQEFDRKISMQDEKFDETLRTFRASLAKLEQFCVTLDR